MKNFKQVKVLIIMILILSLVVGCSKKNDKTSESTTGDTTDKTQSTDLDSDNPLRPSELDTIKVVLFGEESPRMSELMENEFQQIFIDEINTKVELEYLPWTENGAGGKVDLMIASGQDFDAAIIDPTWAASSVSKGYIQDLSGVIDKYLPDWKQVMNSDVCFKPYTYGDKIYAIPIGNKPTAGVFNTVCVRQDIMDQLGLTSMSSLDDLTNYVEKAKEEYPEMTATYDLASSEYLVRAAGDRNITPITNDLWIDQDTKELVNFADSDEFEKVVRLYNNWYKKDLLPHDILTNTVTQPFQAGMTFFFRGTCGSTVIENEPALKQIVPTAYTKEYYLNPDKPIYKNSYESTAFQVPVTSKKADRVALFVNTLQKNTELADAFIYGIEGKDYEIQNDKIVAKQTDELFYQWMVFNVNISHFDERFPDDFMDTYKNWDNGSLTDITYGFTVNYDNIKTQKAQIDTIWTELAMPMLAGVKDYDAGIDELKTALQKAGWDDYIAEIQKQYDEFLSKQGQ